MNYSKKLKEKQKKILLGGTLSVLIIIMLILVIKLAGLSVPINALANIKNYISRVISNEKEISGVSDTMEANGISQISETGTSPISYNDVKLQNTSTETYIYDAQDLCDFRNDVNEGKNYAGKTVYLMADIDMRDVCSSSKGSWEPIGLSTDATGNAVYFSGTFDGNYHKIDNLYMNTNNYQYLGLFTAINSTAIIKDLIIRNASIYASFSTNASKWAGIIVGMNYGEILNCGIQSGSITMIKTNANSGSNWKIMYAGGVAGGNSGTISSCYNRATVKSQNIKSNYNSAYAAGIASNNAGTVRNCYNSGIISVNGYYVLSGGIAAQLNNNGNIYNSYNYGSITASGSNTTQIAGIEARNYGGSNVSNCYCTNTTTYSYYTGDKSATTTGRIAPETLKTYAPILGSAYENDDWNINDGYPILWWEEPRLQLDKNQAYIKTNEELQLSANLAYCIESIPKLENLKVTDFEWTSTNEDVATVNQSGKVIGKKDGYTTIYARHKSNDLYAMCIVNVAKDTATPQITTGNRFTAILKSNGKVYTIGNSAEQNSQGIPCPVKIDQNTELENVRKIAVGSNHILALTNEGKVYAWGDNGNGQLGTGDTDYRKYATPVLGTDKTSYLENIVDIEAGGYGSVALDENGNVYVWGKGTNGEIGNNQKSSKNIPTRVIGVKFGIQVSIGNGHVGALTSDGAVWDWGLNTNGQLGIGSTANALCPTRATLDVTEISFGGYHTAIKKIDGSLYVAGIGTKGILGLTGTGNQKTFTKVNLDGILTGGRKIKYVKSGIANTTILLSDKTVWETGFNLHGELGNGTNVTSTNFIQGLMGENTPIENVLTIGKNMGDINGSDTLGWGLDTAIILENGEIYTTGNNEHRQIGNNDTKDKTYYTKMGYAYLDYAEKSVELEGAQGYQIDREKIRYIQSVVNAYNNEPLLEVGEVKYKIQDTSLATVNSNGYITANEGVTGATKVEIEDIEHGYKAYFTVIVNKLENTDTVTYIYDSQDMCEFRDSVNVGNSYAGKTVYVMADIDMSDVCSSSIGSWKPIGTTVYFSGTFDGNYHTIENLYMDTNEYLFLGLFTGIAPTAIIKNLSLDNISIYDKINQGSHCTGGIVGWSRGTILNCGVKSGTITGCTPVGGIVGAATSGSVLSCFNKATIKTTYQSVDYNGIGGGIVGMTENKVIIESCYNKGNITANSTSCYSLGGIIGHVASDTTSGSLIKNCYNIGYITIGINKGGIIAGYTSGGTISVSNNYWLSECGATYGWARRTSNAGASKVNSSELKNYASTLGLAYENDDWNINDGYPILWWEAPTIQLNKRQAYINKGEELQLSVVGVSSARPLEEVQNITITDFKWTSSNEDIVTVTDGGLIKGLEEGYTTIYGKYTNGNGKVIYAMCIVNVAGEDNIAMPQVETGENFTAILKSDGTVWTVGNINSADQNLMEIPQQVKINETENLTNVIKIAVGSNHVLALTKDGEVYAWGDNQYGQLGINNNNSKKYATKVSGEGGSSYLNRIIDISAGAYGSSAINEFGWVYTWGNGTYGEMGNGTTVSNNAPTKTVLNNGISVSTGAGHNVELAQNGKVYTWGRNNAGQLGIGSTANSAIVLKAFETATEISASGLETVVKDIAGKVYLCGLNISEQLGDGKYATLQKLTARTLPTEATQIIPAENPVKYIKAGTGTIAIQLKDGAVYTVGINTNGELGNGTNTNQSSFVRAMTDCSGTANHVQGGEQEEIEQQDGEISPKELENTLIIGRSNGENTSLDIATINQDGRVYVSGANDYSQIRDDGTEEKHYFTSMRSIDLICPDIIKVEYQGTKELKEEELRYEMEYFNVYETDQESGSLLENAEILDTGVATYENPILTGIEVGNTTLQVEDEEKNIYVDIPVRVMDPNRELDFIRVNNIEAELQLDGTYLVKAKDLGEKVTITAQTLKNVASVKLAEDEEYIRHTITKENVDLDEIETIITVYVQAEDGKLAQYTLKILKVSGNTAIEELSVKMTIEKQAEGEEVQTEEITEVIQPQEDGNYYLKIERVEEVDVKAILEDPKASVKIKNSRYKLAENEQKIGTVSERTEIIITVMADDGTIKDYTLVLEKKSNDTTIRITETDEIQRIEDYKVYVSEDLETLNLTITTNSDYASLKFKEVEEYTEKQITKTIDLTQEVVPEEGEIEPGIPVYVEVQAEDGTIAEYTIRVIRSGNVRLLRVEIEEQEIENEDDKYRALVSARETTKIEITAESETSKIEIIKVIEKMEGNIEQVIGTSIGTLTKDELPLEENPQSYIIRVTSAKATTKKDYELIIRQKSKEAGIDYVKVNGTEVENEENVYTYYMSEDEFNAEVQILAKDDKARIEVDENNGEGYLTFNEAFGEDTIKVEKEIRVTSEDGTTEEIYTLILYKKTQIMGAIITENYEQKYMAKVKLYKRKKKEDDPLGGDVVQDIGETITGDMTEELPQDEEMQEVEEELILDREIETEEDGNFVLEITEVGTYDVVIEKPGYLSYTLAKIEITPGLVVEIQEHKLIAGEEVEDGEIEIGDLVELNANLGIEITEDNKEEKGKYDLNEDGTIDMTDRTILKKNYGKKTEYEEWVDPNSINSTENEEDE